MSENSFLAYIFFHLFKHYLVFTLLIVTIPINKFRTNQIMEQNIEIYSIVLDSCIFCDNRKRKRRNKEKTCVGWVLTFVRVTHLRNLETPLFYPFFFFFCIAWTNKFRFKSLDMIYVNLVLKINLVQIYLIKI